MAKRVFHSTNWTAAAQADGVLATPYQALMCGTAAQRVELNEIMIMGLAGATQVSILQLARCSANHSGAATLLAPNSDGPMDPATAALGSPVVALINHTTTGPTRSNAITDARLELNINAYGGIIRWNSGPDLKWILATVTAPAAESVLSAFTGSTSSAISSHMIYEPL